MHLYMYKNCDNDYLFVFLRAWNTYANLKCVQLQTILILQLKIIYVRYWYILSSGNTSC